MLAFSTPQPKDPQNKASISSLRNLGLTIRPGNTTALEPDWQGEMKCWTEHHTPSYVSHITYMNGMQPGAFLGYPRHQNKFGSFDHRSMNVIKTNLALSIVNL
jgi:hypothetical protein